MTWYTAYYGSWNDPAGVQHIPGTYSYREICERAQAAANQHNVTVTIRGERGMRLEFHAIKPLTSHDTITVR